MNPNLKTLKAALSTAGDADALAGVRQRAGAIRDAMGDEDVDLTAEQLEYLDQHPEWVGEVYAALGDDLESGEDSAIAQAIKKVRENEATEIGGAFAELMEQLAEVHYDSMKRFKPIRYPDDDSLPLNEPSVVAAKHHGLQLIRLTGLTPSMIYEATRGLHLLFERVARSLADSGNDPPEEKWLTHQPDHEAQFRIRVGETVAPIPNELVLAEIAGTPNLPKNAVEPLCNWIGDVLSFQPFLIEGYRYDGQQRSFTPLAQLNIDIPRELIAQWSQHDRRTHATRHKDRVAPELSLGPSH